MYVPLAVMVEVYAALLAGIETVCVVCGRVVELVDGKPITIVSVPEEPLKVDVNELAPYDKAEVEVT